MFLRSLSPAGRTEVALRKAGRIALGAARCTDKKSANSCKPWPSVFLQAPVDELWRRSSEAGNQALRKDREQFSQLYAKRLPFYQQATVIVETLDKDLRCHLR